MNLNYLNAINILASAKIDTLQNIYDTFNGDFEYAWKNNLNKFLPTDYKKIKDKINPEREFEILKKEGIEIITIFNKKYPQILKEISRPPFLLYVKGNSEILSSNCFGIVGTRTLTDYGKKITPIMARDLACAGFTIVSGLALGIDASAHQATLDLQKPTIAVLGCGLSPNVFYPPQNKKLAKQIIDSGGAIITEYSFNTRGSAISFPQRNRIISGLSKGVLIIEAGLKSGSLITARNAVEQNRDVFVVPGSIFSKMSEGTNLYIQKGAKPVTKAEDILTEYII